MRLANGLALRLGRNAITSDHLFLGILELGEGIGSAALTLLSVNLHDLHDSIYRRLPSASPRPCASCGYDLRGTPDRCPECGRAPRDLVKLPMAIELTGVIDRARPEALALGDDYVGTEHLCLSAAATGSPLLKSMLHEAQLNPERLRLAVLLTQAPALLVSGSSEAALRKYELGLKVDASNPTLCNDMAWLLATCGDRAIRDGRRALALATRACEATRFEKASCVDTLAAANAELGDFARAIELARRALQITPDEHRDSVVQHLTSYERGNAWREQSPGEPLKAPQS